MTNFEVFLTQIGFLPKPTPQQGEPVRQATNDWHKQGKECPF